MLIFIGANKGLINIKGNLTRTVKVIVDEGVSEGGAESIKLKAENEKAPMSIVGIMINKFMEALKPKKIIPINNGIVEKNIP